METIVFHSKGQQDTFLLGEKLGQEIKKGLPILLSGELGAGKTVFIKGLAAGLGIKEEINSPTYILIKEYQGRLPLYHMDLYRLENRWQLVELGFDEYLEKKGVTAIEWPDLTVEIIEEYDHLEIKIDYLSADERKIKILSEGKQAEELLNRLKEKLKNNFKKD